MKREQKDKEKIIPKNVPRLPDTSCRLAPSHHRWQTPPDPRSSWSKQRQIGSSSTINIFEWAFSPWNPPPLSRGTWHCSVVEAELEP
jgi:hypothetical protein